MPVKPLQRGVADTRSPAAFNGFAVNGVRGPSWPLDAGVQAEFRGNLDSDCAGEQPVGLGSEPGPQTQHYFKILCFMPAGTGDIFRIAQLAPPVDTDIRRKLAAYLITQPQA